MKPLYFIIFCSLLLLIPSTNHAQDITKELAKGPKVSDLLLNYPADVRQAFLEASLYPNTISKMSEEQRETQKEFERLISPQPRKTQEKIYNLVRYPDLLGDLVEGGEKSKGQIKEIANDYPKGVQEAAKDLGKKEYPLLRNIHQLYTQSDQKFESLTQPLPQTGRDAYRKLLQYPEVLTTLSENRDLTIALGDAYRRNPSETQTKLTELSQTMAKDNDEALQDYRQTLKNNPKAQEELKRSSKDFAEQYGYEDDYEDYPPPDDYSDNTVIVNVNPYPYWFGYPYWYPDPFWRPYPWWYLGGFSIGFGGGFFAWGWPSYWYTNWFYGYPSNFYHYPHLAGCYGNYYNRWRDRPVHNHFQPVIKTWADRNRDYVSNDLWRNDSQQVQRWRDFGKNRRGDFSSDASRHSLAKPQGQIDQPSRWQNERNGGQGRGSSDQFRKGPKGNPTFSERQPRWNNSQDLGRGGVKQAPINNIQENRGRQVGKGGPREDFRFQPNRGGPPNRGNAGREVGNVQRGNDRINNPSVQKGPMRERGPSSAPQMQNRGGGQQVQQERGRASAPMVQNRGGGRARVQQGQAARGSAPRIQNQPSIQRGGGNQGGRPSVSNAPANRGPTYSGPSNIGRSNMGRPTMSSPSSSSWGRGSSSFGGGGRSSMGGGNRGGGVSSFSRGGGRR